MTEILQSWEDLNGDLIKYYPIEGKVELEKKSGEITELEYLLIDQKIIINKSDKIEIYENEVYIGNNLQEIISSNDINLNINNRIFSLREVESPPRYRLGPPPQST